MSCKRELIRRSPSSFYLIRRSRVRISVASVSRCQWTSSREQRMYRAAMMTHRTVGLLGSAAWMMVVLYLGVVLLAGGCVSMPASPSGTHSHSHDSHHSSLCVWSCQILSQSGLVASVPTAVLFLISFPVMSLILSSVSVAPFASRHSRAPPVFTLGSFRRNAFLDCVSGSCS